MTRDEINALIDEYAAKLAEHCDSVRILATRTEGPDTEGFSRGRGDWYAQAGMCHEFLKAEDQRCLAKEIAREMNP